MTQPGTVLMQKMLTTHNRIYKNQITGGGPLPREVAVAVEHPLVHDEGITANLVHSRTKGEIISVAGSELPLGGTLDFLVRINRRLYLYGSRVVLSERTGPYQPVDHGHGQDREVDPVRGLDHDPGHALQYGMAAKK